MINASFHSRQWDRFINRQIIFSKSSLSLTGGKRTKTEENKKATEIIFYGYFFIGSWLVAANASDKPFAKSAGLPTAQKCIMNNRG